MGSNQELWAQDGRPHNLKHLLCVTLQPVGALESELIRPL